MSSIKREVKKKASPRPEARFLSRDPAHCSFIPLEKFGLLSILVSFSVDGDAAVESGRAASETGCFRSNHGSIRGSWPMAISGYPRGHNVIWVTRCPKHTGPISLTDTPIEPSILEALLFARLAMRTISTCRKSVAKGLGTWSYARKNWEIWCLLVPASPRLVGKP